MTAPSGSWTPIPWVVDGSTLREKIVFCCFFSLQGEYDREKTNATMVNGVVTVDFSSKQVLKIVSGIEYDKKLKTCEK